MPFIILTIFVYFVAFLGIFALGGKKNAYADKVAVGASLVSLAAFLAMLLNPARQGEFALASYHASGFTFDFGFLVDKLSLLMGGIVSFVTTLVLLYSRDYMREDPEKGRFFALLCFFAGSMLGIVYSVSFAQLFIFWELVGLSSYFLIGFWWRDPVVAASSRKVFTMIVVGDVFLLLGFLILGSAFGTFTFSEMLHQYNHVALPAIGVFLVLLGAFVKSAQLPFSMWLPWAMEGPTPVSALLHSATMVKAGVFLIARILPLVFAAHLGGFVVVFALATIFVASLLALAEEDIKRILAYSTISQLGFIAFGLGLGAYGAALFHLFNDAFYKALLFLGAGVIIHAGGSRNIFELKPLHWTKEKAFLLFTLIGVLGISGLPPFNGFFSKDLILDAAKESGNPVLFALSLAAAFLSALYISRWGFLIWRNIEYPSTRTTSEVLARQASLGDKNELIPERSETESKNMPSTVAPSHPSTAAHEFFGPSTKIPMGILASGVILTGWLGARFFHWIGLEEVPRYHVNGILASLALVAAAFFISYACYFRQIFSIQNFTNTFQFVYKIIRAKFGVMWFYNLLARFLYALGSGLYVFDRYIIDSVLHGAAAFGRGASRIANGVDRIVIDGILHATAKSVIATCFGSERLDMSGIDGIVRSFYHMLIAAGTQVRKMVTGLTTSYVTALVVAVIVSILFLNGVLAR